MQIKNFVLSRKKIKFEIFVIIFFIFFFSYEKSVLADSNDCSALSGDAQQQCEDLEKKARIYEDLIKLKNKQQDALAGQLDSINSEQAKTVAQLQETQKQVQTLQQQIDNLEENIKDGEAAMNFQKNILAGLMQSYYEYDQQGILPVVLTNAAFSDILNQSDYIEQSGAKVSDVLAEVIRTRQKLIDDQNTLKQKKEEIDGAKNDLIDKKENLQSTENQKTNLLVQTQGEEVKYKQLLANAEAQRAELFDFSAASNIDDVKQSVGGYAKPSSNLASTSWYFSQLDSRWGKMKIGNSNSLMEDYGCAVTSLAMVFREKGASTDPGKMAKQKIFSFDLIKWPGSWSPGISLVSSISHGNISWSTVDAQIKKGNPVIVYLSRSRGGGHYVVVTGKDSKDYIVHDPYFGANLYLSTSKSLVGKLGANSSVSVNQMIIYN
ncbi:MAG: C39 family peptidase [Candidatus Moranbacteria bacterium]|nr:C39 family peptidase [Candidatus Moranbacteria bacterium]